MFGNIDVSIIIPVYNMEKYIGEALESVEKQTLKQVEVICIDDGSTDGSWELLCKYAKRYTNISIYQQENAGVGNARNLGIKKARGKYICFLDADDFYYANNTLENLYNKAREKDVLICGGSACNYRDGIITQEGIRKGNVFNCEGYIKYIDYPVIYGFWKFIYQREFLIKNNIFFPNYRRCQDPPFFVKAMIMAEQFYAVKEICYCYRKEHKEVIFDAPKISDYAKGMRDTLILSRTYGLPALHTEIINEIHTELSAMIYREIADGSSELENILADINASIDEKLVCKERITCNKLYLLSVSEILPYMSGIEMRKGEFIEGLEEKDAVYVYGAGIVGKRVLKFLRDEGINIKAILVTTKNQNPDYVEDVPVKEVDNVKIKDTEVVIIATFPYLHDEIAKVLSDRNVRNIEAIDLEEFIMYEKELKH